MSERDFVKLVDNANDNSSFGYSATFETVHSKYADLSRRITYNERL
jgi:Txe/YoeB family toxin of Txe-Axe toxin-antitoxin module